MRINKSTLHSHTKRQSRFLILLQRKKKLRLERASTWRQSLTLGSLSPANMPLLFLNFPHIRKRGLPWLRISPSLQSDFQTRSLPQQMKHLPLFISFISVAVSLGCQPCEDLSLSLWQGLHTLDKASSCLEWVATHFPISTVRKCPLWDVQCLVLYTSPRTALLIFYVHLGSRPDSKGFSVWNSRLSPYPFCKNFIFLASN